MGKKTLRDLGLTDTAFKSKAFAFTELQCNNGRYTVNINNNNAYEDGDGLYYSEPLVPLSYIDDINASSIFISKNDIDDDLMDITVILDWDFRLGIPINKDEGNDYIPMKTNYKDVIDLDFLIKNNFSMLIVNEGCANTSIYIKDGRVSKIDDSGTGEIADTDTLNAIDAYIKSGKILDMDLCGIYIRNPDMAYEYEHGIYFIAQTPITVDSMVEEGKAILNEAKEA